jgi:hypothetical protein
MDTPGTRSPLGWRLLLVVSAVCFFLAALTVAGSDILDAPVWAWGFGGFSAWALAGAVP